MSSWNLITVVVLIRVQFIEITTMAEQQTHTEPTAVGEPGSAVRLTDNTHGNFHHLQYFLGMQTGSVLPTRNRN